MATAPPSQGGVVLTAELDAIVTTDIAVGQTLKVQAAAGSGKSTALRLYAARRPLTPTLYLTFTAAEARAKEDDYARRGLSHVVVSTLHALAYGCTHDLHRGRALNAFELSALDVANLTGSSCLDWPAPRRAAVCRVLDCLFASDASELEPKHAEGVGSDRGVLAAARAVWSAARDPARGLPLTHDAYLKVCCVCPKRRAAMFAGIQLAMLDEAHDCTEAQLSLVVGPARHWGCVLVYDFHQRIYGWRRAASEAYLRALPAAACLHLSCSWRFGDVLARLASLLVRRHTATGSTAMAGNVSRATAIQEVPSPPFRAVCGARVTLAVVARTRHTLFTFAMAAVVSGAVDRISFGERGAAGAYDMFDGRERLLDTFALYYDRTAHSMLAPGQGAARFVEQGFAMYRAAAYANGWQIAIEACRVVELYGLALPALLRQLDAALSCESSRELLLLSVHEAKGGEWSHVYVADDLRHPGSLCTEEVAGYRLNLVYVAMTRATRALYLPTPIVSSWLQPVGIRV